MRDPDKFLSPEHFWFGDLNVYNDIHHERIRAHRKHDSNDIDNERIRVHRKHVDYGGSMERKEFTDSAWMPVLVEEVGEVARELCDYRHSIDRSGFKRRLRDELIQVAAMATAWICAIDSDQPEPATGAVAGEPEDAAGTAPESGATP